MIAFLGYTCHFPHLCKLQWKDCCTCNENKTTGIWQPTYYRRSQTWARRRVLVLLPSYEKTTDNVHQHKYESGFFLGSCACAANQYVILEKCLVCNVQSAIVDFTNSCRSRIPCSFQKMLYCTWILTFHISIFCVVHNKRMFVLWFLAIYFMF